MSDNPSRGFARAGFAHQTNPLSWVHSQGYTGDCSFWGVSGKLDLQIPHFDGQPAGTLGQFFGSQRREFLQEVYKEPRKAI